MDRLENIDAIKGCPKLECVIMSSANTIRDFSPLNDLMHLKKVIIGSSKLSAEQVEKIRSTLPSAVEFTFAPEIEFQVVVGTSEN